MIESIEKKIVSNGILTKQEVEFFLDYIILSIKAIVKDETFINKCDLVQGLIGRYLNHLGIPNYPCITNKCVMPNVVGHSFIVATINNINYIIDPTFVQFAYIKFDELYINHLKVKSKSPFDYAVSISKDMTKTLINKGYIELNNKSAYWYGNSFYHTLTNIKDNYKFSDVSGEIYIDKFLKGNEILRQYDYSEIKTSTFNKSVK